MDLNQIGLILNIIGTVLIFKYGLPSKIIETPDTAIAVPIIGRKKEDVKRDKNRNLFITRMANIGIGLILMGFVLQFLSTLKWFQQCP